MVAKKKVLPGLVGLGDRARDKVTGLEGIVVGISRWLTGCDTVSVEPVSTDGKRGDTVYFDIGRMEVLEREVVSTLSTRQPPREVGGPALGG